MIDEALFDAEEKMEKAVTVAREDLASIRTGRANPGMFNRINIDYYGSMTPGVVELWKLFGYYPEYWIKKTGHSGTNSFVEALDDKGIDGLRCDFGQGLPPQIWEYIINRTRKLKWNFMFMAETLDGGNPGYRSNRHFDILNESFVFQFTQAKVNNSFDIYNALEQRRNAYSGGTILLNLTSHDEIFPDDDPWVTVSRYGAVSSVRSIIQFTTGSS